MPNEKKFFRVKLSDHSPVNARMINGVNVTKNWQIRTGEPEAFTKFPNVEAQVVVKKGNDFVPFEEAKKAAPVIQPASTASNFEELTVEQLRTLLAAQNIPMSELRSLNKLELIERARELSGV